MSRALFRYKEFTTRQDPGTEPEYAAVCVSGETESCLERSGHRIDPITVDDWMRRHMVETGHCHFRRTFVDFAELLPTHGLEPAAPVKGELTA
ncbi:DUF7848 domain-containing protein [Streptomyces xanthochromogenes]|uniref:DUF7848 domain-containing protein n=1 Tax=Streptomyces xanthochromogenes TaxID=67384 RepID=UPI00382F2B37